MIAADDIGPDTRLMKPLHLARQKPGRLHRGLVAVVKVTGDNQRVDLLVDAEIDNGNKSLTRRIADKLGEVAVAHRQRPQRGIEVQIGRVNKSKWHATMWDLQRVNCR